MGLSPGDVVLDRYVIEALIGQGGMGEVYRARHVKLGMPVAVKTIVGDASPELVARFAREAQLLARVRHQNVVSILDVGTAAGGTECMVMEFLEGEGLDARLERRKVLPWNEVRAIGMAVLQGLDAIHGAGIVHRDLKPSNVLVVKGTPEIVKLVDFGIAHSAQAAKYTRTGAVIGTPAYMSPEQLVGADLDARSDLYSLALMLYELCAGRLPFGDEPTTALKRLRDPVPPPRAPAGMPALPAAGVTAILRALAIEVGQRPATARDLYALLQAARPTAAAPGRTQSAPRAATQASPAVSPAQARHAQAQPQPPAHVQRPARAPAAAMRGAPPPPMQPEPEPEAYDAEPQELATYAAHAPQPMPMQPALTGYGTIVRAVVAARLPVSRMSREEQKMLAQIASPGRTYHLGGGVWFAVISGQSEQEVAARAGQLAGTLHGRYGDTCKIVWSPASAGFSLTPASLSGAAPLPPDITRLLEKLL